MNDRSKLAEAMGLKCSCNTAASVYVTCKVHDLGDILGCPDPFTDANDDYAVLEWVRNERQGTGDICEFESPQCDYQIGDHARAALKVLQEQSDHGDCDCSVCCPN